VFGYNVNRVSRTDTCCLHNQEDVGICFTIQKICHLFTFKGPCIAKYIPIIVQQDATKYSSFIPVNLSTCFVWYLHPTSGVHVTVSTASGISKTVTATCREGDWTGTAVPVQSPSLHGFTSARCCGYSDMNSRCWVEVPHETCRAVYRYK